MSLGGKAVVIVGMCRSGTSSVAGALAKLGVFFGKPDDLYAADESNEQGYWEHRAVNAANRKFHLSLNLAALDVDPIPMDWRQRPMTESILANTSSILKSHFSSRPVWGWKDPQASSLLPYVSEVFARASVPPTIVICVRNPIDVAASQKKRQGTPVSQTLGGWLLNTLAALRDSKGMARYVVLYEQFLHTPRPSIEPIIESLRLSPTDSEWQAATGWVRTDLSHGNGSLSDLDAYPTIISATYKLCVEIADAPDLFNTGSFDERINALWEEWITMHSMFWRPPFPEANLGLSWERAGQRQVHQTSYRPSASWQKIRCASRALPGSRVSIYLYGLPAVVWIRKTIWRQGEIEIPAPLLSGLHGQLDHESGLHRVWLNHGYEQIAVAAPVAKGQFELELEVLIESNNLIAGMTFQNLSQRADGR